MHLYKIAHFQVYNTKIKIVALTRKFTVKNTKIRKLHIIIIPINGHYTDYDIF